MRLRELSQTKFALGGDITLAIISDIPTSSINHLFDELWKQVYVFERRFSRFLPMSELSLFNRFTGLQNPITPEFRSLLLSSKQLGIETGGLFNPFIIPALQRAGYSKSAALGYEGDIQTDYTNRRVVDIERLGIGNNWASIPYGTAIDLGGCGKGYLADRLGEILSNRQIQGYWMSLGGDVITMGRDEKGDLVSLNIQDANDLCSTTGWIINCPEKQFATATSGTFKRKGQDVSTSWHHIIDSSTLKPAATDIRLATVCADTAVRADVLASCAVILGSKRASGFLKKHGVKAALLQCVDKKGVDFEIMFGKRIKRAIKNSHVGVS